MVAFVVDTNVPMAANGRETHADMRCQLRCVETLKSVIQQGIVAIDDKGMIVNEYRRRLSLAGAPGVGDAFSRYVFDNQYRDDRVQRVAVKPSEDDRRGFEELPRNKFDRSDRKFLAVAVVANAVVLNAVDNDWSEQEALMQELNVRVEELCPQHLNER
ncbi:MAG: hypothetical protein OXI57_02250 [Rhodospirillales bacterium]|nr:hypothetical protein [Rhodospirillales bacterium]